MERLDTKPKGALPAKGSPAASRRKIAVAILFTLAVAAMAVENFINLERKEAWSTLAVLVIAWGAVMLLSLRKQAGPKAQSVPKGRLNLVAAIPLTFCILGAIWSFTLIEPPVTRFALTIVFLAACYPLWERIGTDK